MKITSTFFSILIATTFIFSICIAQNDISEKLTESAIDTRIADIRIGDIIVKTAPGADVKVQQVRHEFLFGTALPNSLADNARGAMPEETRKKFIEVLKDNFNYAVHENALKWYSCERVKDVVDYSTADRIWEICNELNIPMRGHCIYWAKEQYVMDWLKTLDNDELRERIISHGKDVTEHFKGRITEYDLNNEMINGNYFRSRFGDDIINVMAMAAKEGNPDCVLYVNDYDILVEGCVNADKYIAQIEDLLAKGVPIGGIGCQAHTISASAPDEDGRSRKTDPETFQANLDRLAKFNLPIKLTETLFDGANEQETAEQLRKYFRISFAHPNVEAIVLWGFWAGSHWQPQTAMWLRDWIPTAQAEAYRNLVFNEWWTDVSGKADETGQFKTDAFYGDYIITSNSDTKNVTLSKKGKSIEVVF